MMKYKQHGLVADLMPNIRLMQSVGHCLFNYYNESGSMRVIHKAFCGIHYVLVLVQMLLCAINLLMEMDDADDLAANTITLLFFMHGLTKVTFLFVMKKSFYRTFAIWNNPNSHPMFAESNARYHAVAVSKMRTLLIAVTGVSVMTAVSWTGLTFMGPSVKTIMDKETNETMTVEIPRLLLRSWYPFDASSGTAHIVTLIYQFYFVLFLVLDANEFDVLFCSWLIVACEQLQHLKDIMKPLIELSATLDSVVPHSNELFKAGSSDHLRDNQPPPPSNDAMENMDLRGIYSNRQDFTAMFRSAAGYNGNVGPNGLTAKQESLVRNAIKYWVERHKHIVRLVSAIGDTYGMALLFHMLTSTITLTLLAYQATKVNGLNAYGFSTIGYIAYTFAQIFHFCVFGNRLIDESSSVLEAAYSCQWYDGSEEAKTFVQIVCQQCQKALTISGAKFFTVSLDLFASVLGAIVTYFMVLVQLS